MKSVDLQGIARLVQYCTSKESIPRNYRLSPIIILTRLQKPLSAKEISPDCRLETGMAASCAISHDTVRSTAFQKVFCCKARSSDACSFTRDSIVTVRVGPEKTLFHVHRTILVEKIPYFKALLGADWNDSQKDTIEIDDVPVASFEIVTHWVYIGKLPESMQVEYGTRDDYLSSIDADASKAADRLMVATLQNAICDHLIESDYRCAGFYNWASLKQAWNMRLSHAPFHRLIMKSVIETFMQLDPDDQEAWIAGLDQLSDYPDGMKDVIICINSFNKAPWGELFEFDSKDFHVEEVEVAQRR